MFKVLFPLPIHLRSLVIQHLQVNKPFISIASFTTGSAPSYRSDKQYLQPRRPFSSTAYGMSDLSVELTAPNGKKYTQPTGLFINNEWVKSSNGQKITSINPT
jgi:hypothetical protein